MKFVICIHISHVVIFHNVLHIVVTGWCWSLILRVRYIRQDTFKQIDTCTICYLRCCNVLFAGYCKCRAGSNSSHPPRTGIELLGVLLWDFEFSWQSLQSCKTGEGPGIMWHCWPIILICISNLSANTYVNVLFS